MTADLWWVHKRTQLKAVSSYFELWAAQSVSVLMLHSNWNNPTVFQTLKWVPNSDNTPNPRSPPTTTSNTPHPSSTQHTHSPHRSPSIHPTNQPTSPIPWSPALIWVETFWVEKGGDTEEGGRALSWHKGGRRRNSEHSQAFLNKDMSGIQAPLAVKSLSFAARLSNTLVRALLSSTEVVRSEVEPSAAALHSSRCRRRSGVFSAITGDKHRPTSSLALPSACNYWGCYRRHLHFL